MTPELERDIRARAATLLDMTTLDPMAYMAGYLDRHALLAEIDSLRAVAVFLVEFCAPPEEYPGKRLTPRQIFTLNQIGNMLATRVEKENET